MTKLRAHFRLLSEMRGNAGTPKSRTVRTLMLSVLQGLRTQTNQARLQTRHHFRPTAQGKFLVDKRLWNHHRIQEKNSCNVSVWTCPCPSSSQRWFFSADLVVDCPVCGDSVKLQMINAHMDGPSCGQKPSSKKSNASNPHAKSAWSTLLGGKSEKGKNKQNR